MVFAVPDWEDGNRKKTTIFSEATKTKVKKQNVLLVLEKPPKNISFVKKSGVVNKSKLIVKKNKRQLAWPQQPQQNNIKLADVNKSKKKVEYIQIEKLKNSPSKNVQKSGKLVKDISRKRKHEKTLKHFANNLKDDSIDTDKLDEVLLNAKKNKLNEALKQDDVEALLFKEDKNSQNIKKKNKETQQKSKAQKTEDSVYNQSLTANRKINKGKSDVKLNNVILKANEKEVEKNKPQTTLKQPKQDKTKNKLKLMINKESKRNPINFNRNKLRERMLDRLKSAQFRFLNEKLYTSSGNEASQIFQNDPVAFHTYHEGYQQQLKKWPINPLDVIVKRIKKMPKTHLIADMGCGSGTLSQQVPHTVRSFDLVSASIHVETCDMAHTPLLTGSMDAVVYCLALMGTELTQYLLEANRVLKTGGHLLIAEVESRFADVNTFTKEVARLGFKLVKLDSEREVFFFMEFVKNQEAPVKKSKLPVLTLKPCIYKRR